MILPSILDATKWHHVQSEKATEVHFMPMTLEERQLKRVPVGNDLK